MNKKLLFGAVLAAGLTACSDEALELETAASKPAEAKALTGVTFDITKSGNEAETRATWNANNTISFEKTDLISLYHLGYDGMEGLTSFPANPITDTTNPLTAVDNVTKVEGRTNAIFKTGDGKKFESESVVYEGYNLLVYPANRTHVTVKAVEVSVPASQDGGKNYLDNVVYISDSIMHIHAPKENAAKKLVDMWGVATGKEDPNTSGYGHHIKTSMKPLSSIFDLKFKIENAGGRDVKIKKVELVSNKKDFVTKGNITANTSVDKTLRTKGNFSKYLNPWIAPIPASNTEVVTFANPVNNEAKIVLLPVQYDAANKYVIKVTTNFGVVTIGDDDTADAQSRLIMDKTGEEIPYKTEAGVRKPTDNDKDALKQMLLATKNVNNSIKIEKKLSMDAGATADKYRDNWTGSIVSRVIKVDMSKAKVSGMEVSSTAELNDALSAVRNEKADPIEIKLNHVGGDFVLSDFKLNSFTKNLKLVSGKDLKPGSSETLKNIVVNTTSVTALENVNGLDPAIKLVIPATSAINTIKAATAPAVYAIANPIENQKTISVPANSQIKLADNSKGIINWEGGKIVADASFGAAKYGTIASVAKTQGALNDAKAAGVNDITVNNLESGFFTARIEAATTDALVSGTPIKLTMNNCGDLSSTVPGGITSNDLVLSGNTSYTKLDALVTLVEIKGGTSTIGDSNTLAYIAVHGGATANINKITTTSYTLSVSGTATLNDKCSAPDYLYALGTVDYKGNGNVTITEVEGKNVKNYTGGSAGTAVITGTLTTAKDLAYNQVYVSATTKITGKVAYINEVWVSEDSQAEGTANLYWMDTANTVKHSWNGIKF